MDFAKAISSHCDVNGGVASSCGCGGLSHQQRPHPSREESSLIVTPRDLKAVRSNSGCTCVPDTDGEVAVPPWAIGIVSADGVGPGVGGKGACCETRTRVEILFEANLE